MSSADYQVSLGRLVARHPLDSNRALGVFAPASRVSGIGAVEESVRDVMRAFTGIGVFMVGLWVGIILGIGARALGWRRGP